MTQKNLFLALVSVLSIGLFCLMTVVIGSGVFRLIVQDGEGTGHGGIVVAAGGVSWWFLKILVFCAFFVFLAVIALLWAKVASR